MSIVDNLKKATTPKLTARAVAGDLTAANAELSSLRSRLADASLEVVEGKAGADKALAELNAKVAATRERITMLGAAHAKLVAREAAEMMAQRASLRKAQIAALRKHLEARDSAAEALSAAIAQAVTYFKALVERSKKADIIPAGDQMPQGAICEFGAIRSLVAQEIYRLDGGDALTGSLRSFPGAAVLDVSHQGRPEAIVPLADKLKANSAYILATITGQASE